MLKRNVSSRGFTLIELMIGLALLSILIALAAPGFGIFLQNQKVRAKAESILSGLQAARNEALRRNVTVTFILTSDSPVAGMTAPTQATTGPNWVVAIVPVAVVDPLEVLDSYVGAEGASGNAPIIGSNVTSVAFTPLGQTTLAASANIDVTTASGGCVDAGGDVRCLSIEVSPTGQMIMCDPAVTDVGDTRRCPSTPI